MVNNFNKQNTKIRLSHAKIFKHSDRVKDMEFFTKESNRDQDYSQSFSGRKVQNIYIFFSLLHLTSFFFAEKEKKKKKKEGEIKEIKEAYISKYNLGIRN